MIRLPTRPRYLAVDWRDKPDSINWVKGPPTPSPGWRAYPCPECMAKNERHRQVMLMLPTLEQSLYVAPIGA